MADDPKHFYCMDPEYTDELTRIDEEHPDDAARAYCEGLRKKDMEYKGGPIRVFLLVGDYSLRAVTKTTTVFEFE